MKKFKVYILTALFLISALSFASGCSVPGSNKTTAENYINDFLNKDYDAVLNNYEYTASMALALSQDSLDNAYNEYITPLNQFQSLTYQNTYQGTISYLAVFQTGSILLKVTFDDDNKVSGFHIAPYDDIKMPDNITEEEINIGWQYQLSGTLTEPKDEKADTVVILVQGSGPSDKDETVGVLKPFRDIAWGLAQKGVAVFRYDKRTYTYGEKLAQDNSLTVYDEVINDVIYAYNKMHSLGYDNIYIAGHSFGGYLMGRISTELPWADGYIIMAGNVTPIQDLIVTQYNYLAGIDSEITSTEQAQIDAVTKQSDTINALSKQNADNYSASDLLNAPAAYWLDLKDYDPIESMKKCRGKILIMQGAKDYQVTTNEYAKWQSGLDENDNVTYILYDNLNHLFMPSKVMSPDDYADKNYVGDNVINDLYLFVSR